MSNALGPARLTTAPERRRGPAALAILFALAALAALAAHTKDHGAAAGFFAAIALGFGALWAAPYIRARRLPPILAGGFWRRWTALAVVAVIASAIAPNSTVVNVFDWLVIGLVPARLLSTWRQRRSHNIDPGQLPQTARALHQHMAGLGGGCYLATDAQGRLLVAPAQAAALVLAGPRKGKSWCVVAPAVAAHPGPVVAPSTKLELVHATLPVRRQLGDCWYLDLAGDGIPAGCRPVRYSPLARAADWDQAMLVADAMVRSGEGAAHDKPHWKERASALLAGCLHAAAISDRSMRELTGWIMRHDTASPLVELDPASIAHAVLEGIAHTDREERSGIFSTAARVLAAYRSEHALQLAENATFDPDAFVRSTDTLYITAPGDRQRLLAPIVVALLTEIRQARYRAHRHNYSGPPLLMALDEARNIAPIPDLPQQLSEGGGQGVQTMVVLQSLAQARAVWGDEGTALMDFTDAVVILGGVTDKTTCETISRRAGGWDRPIQTTTHQQTTTGLLTRSFSTGQQWTTRREARIPPDQVANIPHGQALVMIATRWAYLPAIPYHHHPCFTQVLAHAQQPAGDLAAGTGLPPPGQS